MNSRTNPTGNNPFVFLVACAVFMLAGIMLLAWLGSPPINPAVGKLLPKIKLSPLVNAESEIVSATLEGKIVVLYLWGPWNPDSRVGIRKIGKLAQRFKEVSRIQFVLVSCPKDVLLVDDLRDATRKVLNESEVELPVYYDSDGQTSMELALLMPYGSLGFPTSIVTDETGRVVRVIEGESGTDYDELEKFLLEYSQ